MGEFETLNFSIGIVPDDIALVHALYRTSIKGRKDLLNLITSDINDTTATMNLDSTYTSRVAEILNVTFKTLGIELEFLNDDQIVKAIDNTTMKSHEIDGKMVCCTDYEFYISNIYHKVRDAVLDDYPIITAKELDKMVREIIESGDVVDGPIADDVLNLIPSNKEVIRKKQKGLASTKDESEKVVVKKKRKKTTTSNTESSKK